MTRATYNKNTVFSFPRKSGLSNINKIAKLAKKKNAKLVDVKFGKKSILFTYSIGQNLICRSYPTVTKGIAGELARFHG